MFMFVMLSILSLSTLISAAVILAACYVSGRAKELLVERANLEYEAEQLRSLQEIHYSPMTSHACRAGL